MSDAPRFDPRSPEQEPQPPVVYATPVKRAWAWVGIAYMVIFTLTFTYYLATARILNGIGPVLLVPALLGLAAAAVLRFRQGQGKGGLPACILITAACILLALCNLAAGLYRLAANFGG